MGAWKQSSSRPLSACRWRPSPRASFGTAGFAARSGPGASLSSALRLILQSLRTVRIGPYRSARHEVRRLRVCAVAARRRALRGAGRAGVDDDLRPSSVSRSSTLPAGRRSVRSSLGKDRVARVSVSRWVSRSVSRPPGTRAPRSPNPLTSTRPRSGGFEMPSAPQRIRTSDLRLRRPSLYPAELVALVYFRRRI